VLCKTTYAELWQYTFNAPYTPLYSDLFLLIRGLALIGWLHQRPEHDDPHFFRELKDATCAECEKLLANLD
jgi:hypothetical protein